MRKFLFLFLILFSLSKFAASDDLDLILNINSTLSFGDFLTTRLAIDNLKFKEKNPIVNLYIKKPVIHLGVYIAADLVTRHLAKKNKKLGKIILIFTIIWRGYVIYHNLRAI